MIGRKLVRLDLSRKLAFSTKWQKRAKEANRFGVLIRRGLAYWLFFRASFARKVHD